MLFAKGCAFATHICVYYKCFLHDLASVRDNLVCVFCYSVWLFVFDSIESFEEGVCPYALHCFLHCWVELEKSFHTWEELEKKTTFATCKSYTHISPKSLCALFY